MSANDNKIVPSDQGRSPVGSKGGETRVATRAYAVRQGDTTLMHLSAERGLDYDEVLDFEEVLELLDKDDELDAAESAPAAQTAGPTLSEHGGSPTQHAGANTPPPAAPAATPPRRDVSLEPQPQAPQWHTVEASVEIEGTPQQRIACPVLYRPSKQSVTARAPRPRAPRRPRP